MIKDENTEIVLFGPRTGKSLFRLYPEIAAEPAFKSIAQDDLLFAWYMGIPNSPVDHNWADPMRHKAAAVKAFPTNQEKRQKYIALDVPEETKIAIRKFETFSPEARLKGKLMMQRMFNNWEEMVDVNVKTDFEYIDKDGNAMIDFTARKQYIDSTRAISEALPAVLKQLEEGFGITETKKTEEMMGTRSIDKYHHSKQENS